jgi:hypothetical protein
VFELFIFFVWRNLMLILILLYLQIILGSIGVVVLTVNYFKGGKNKQMLYWSRGFLSAAALTIILRMVVMFSV